MTPIGHEKDVARARERVGGSIEAVCGVAESGQIGKRFAAAATRGRATKLSVLVLTTDDVYLFEPRLRGFGAELMHVAIADIVEIERPSDNVFRLTFADGSDLQLKAIKGRSYGRDTVDRLSELIAAARAEPSQVSEA